MLPVYLLNLNSTTKHSFCKYVIRRAISNSMSRHVLVESPRDRPFTVHYPLIGLIENGRGERGKLFRAQRVKPDISKHPRAFFAKKRLNEFDRNERFCFCVRRNGKPDELNEPEKVGYNKNDFDFNSEDIQI